MLISATQTRAMKVGECKPGVGTRMRGHSSTNEGGEGGGCKPGDGCENEGHNGTYNSSRSNNSFTIHYLV